MLRSRKCLLLLVIFCGILPQLFTILLPTNANAYSADEVWSWSNNKPIIISVNDLPSYPESWCNDTLQSREIDGEIGEKRVCYTSGDKLSYGTYDTQGYGYASAVALAGDSKMHKLEGVCGDYNDCLYLPDTDTLIVKQHLVNSWLHSLVVYKNVSTRITSELGGPIPSIKYKFNSSNPDYIFRSIPGSSSYNNGYPWIIGSLAASENGIWVVVEFYDRGIGLLNIETLTMKRISVTNIQKYDYGYNPHYEFKISNNGKNIVAMGLNVTPFTYDITENCGDLATDENMINILAIKNICPKTMLYLADYSNDTRMAVDPTLSTDGGELSFTVYLNFSNTEKKKRVTLQASGYIDKNLTYLALGDSFSSGEGELFDKYYIAGTNEKYEKCHQSNRSYPYLIASYFSISSDYAKSVACSGAMMVDVSGDDSNYWGQDDRLSDKGLNTDYPGKVNLQSSALESFIPGRTHQLNFVKKYQPDVITIGIGGNDAGFMEKLKACLAPGTCEWANTTEGKEKTAIEIKNLFENLVKTYQNINNASPRSKILVMGYPKIIDENGDCNFTNNILLDYDEKLFMNEGIKYLNQIISAAAYRAGVEYIDNYNSFGNSVLCGSQEPSSMNNAKTGDDISPSDNMQWLKLIGQESFHPTPIGHQNLANSFISATVNPFSYGYGYCEYWSNICPHTNIIPEPSTYWIPESYHNYPTQHISDYITDIENNIEAQQRTLKLKPESLEPNSQLRIEINSTPQTIGNFISSSDGSLNITVTLPEDSTDGFHTMHIFGTSYTGESIDLYQVFSYIKPTVIPDEDQPPIDETPPPTDETPPIDDGDINPPIDNEDPVDNQPPTDEVSDDTPPPADETPPIDNTNPPLADETPSPDNNNDQPPVDKTPINEQPPIDELQPPQKDNPAIINPIIENKIVENILTNVPIITNNIPTNTPEEAVADDNQYSEQIALSDNPIDNSLGSPEVKGESIIVDKNQTKSFNFIPVISVIGALIILAIFIIFKRSQKTGKK